MAKVSESFSWYFGYFSLHALLRAAEFTNKGFSLKEATEPLLKAKLF